MKMRFGKHFGILTAVRFANGFLKSVLHRVYLRACTVRLQYYGKLSMYAFPNHIANHLSKASLTRKQEKNLFCEFEPFYIQEQAFLSV